MARLRLLLRSARLLGLVALGLGLAAWVSLRERLPGADVTPLRQRLTRWWLARLCAALPFEVRVSGEAPRQPMLWVANHVSWTDIPLLGALAPLTFLSKAEVRAWPLAGWLAEKAGTLFIRRGSGDSRLINQRLAEQLHRGRNLLIFPEGTRIPVGQMGKFSRGGTALAVNAGLPVLPIAHNAGQYWPKAGWAKYPGTIQVVIGPAMHAEGEGPRAIAELNQRAEAWVSETMAEISPIQQRVSHPEPSVVS